MKLLLFAGAGTSVELGVPAMSGMANEFLSHAKQWMVEPDLIRETFNGTMDIEVLIENLDRICAANLPLKSLNETATSFARFETVRAEVEWFVQHVAERIAPRDAHLMWGPLLRTARDHDLAFITTNYDRAIELAANAEGIKLVDGFSEFDANETAEWIGLITKPAVIELVKLHGSTDWFAADSSGTPLKLRHPMPLFGRGTLRLANGTELGSALILPSREKLLTRAPYPRLSQAFLNVADNCDAAVFVGSSLRDAHIRNAAIDIARNRPLFIVNPSGDSCGVPNAYPIAQTASLFLMATLPMALSHSDSITRLQLVSPNNGKVALIPLMRTLMDASELTQRRCEAIEALDQLSISLDNKTIQRLLADEDSIVARYALGLVATSADRASLYVTARSAKHITNPDFSEELELLEQLMAHEEK